MSLQGSLQDFSITNILPMIKTQNNTGILEVKYKEDEIRITFEEGQIVYGATTQAKDSKRLRDTLIANNLLTREDWHLLKKKQTDSLDSIWNVLTTKVPEEDLSRLLNRQITDAVFALLRFKKGAYRFLPSKKIDYPSKLVEPMDVDFLLMDGCRIADEWSVQEKKLPSLDSYLKKSILPDQDPEESTRMKVDEGTDNFYETLEFEVLQEQQISINEDENMVLKVIGKYKSISDLMDMTDLSNFSTCAAIVSLLEKKVIKPMSRKTAMAASRPTARKGAFVGYMLVAAVLALAAGAGYQRFLAFPQQVEEGGAIVNKILSLKAERGMKEILYRLKANFRQTGMVPASLQELVNSGLAAKEEITDPWGRELQYHANNGSFVLYSLGPEELIPGDEIFLKR